MERLNKYLAHGGVGSRRHCEDLIRAGRVSIDGAVVREMGSRIDPQKQKVTVDGQALKQERHVYWLVHKPRGYLCTNHDPAGRPLANDLVPHVPQRVYTVGRLDEDSEGLLLLTNDGDLAYRLMHPRFGVEKTYLVQVAGKPTTEEIKGLLTGIWLSDGHTRARRVKRLRTQGDSTWLEIVLSEGKNREIRRMLARLGHKVMRLRRMAIGPVKLDLRPGKSRPLKYDEQVRLREATERGPRKNEQGEGGQPGQVGRISNPSHKPHKNDQGEGGQPARVGRIGNPSHKPRKNDKGEGGQRHPQHARPAHR